MDQDLAELKQAMQKIVSQVNELSARLNKLGATVDYASLDVTTMADAARGVQAKILTVNITKPV